MDHKTSTHHAKFATNLIRHIPKDEHTDKRPSKRQAGKRTAIGVMFLELLRVDLIEHCVRGSDRGKKIISKNSQRREGASQVFTEPMTAQIAIFRLRNFSQL